jgi:hypothetical protein
LQNRDEFIDWIRQLTFLAERQPLKGNDLATVKTLMRKIKECGYTNREISELTHSSWSESTIKLYTRNVGEGKHQLKAEQLSLLNDMIKQQVSFSDIRSGLQIVRGLEKTDFTVDDMQDLALFFKYKKGLATFILALAAKLRANGISAEDLILADKFRRSLASHGIDIATIQKLDVLLNKYQDKASFLKAIANYDNLSSLEKEIHEREIVKEKISNDLNTIKEGVANLLANKEQLKEEIRLGTEISSLGFTSMMLKDLRELAQNQGSNPDEIVKAIGNYSGLVEGESKVSLLEKQKEQLDQAIIKVEKELEQLTGISNISREFLSKFNFSINDLDLIYEIATRNGDFTSFFKDLARMSSVQGMEKKINDLQGQKLSLETEVSQLQKSKTDLEVQIESVQGIAKSATRQMLTDLENIFRMTTERVTSELNTTFDQLRKTHEDKSMATAELWAKKERLKVCNTIQAIMNNDIELIKRIPKEFLLFFIRGALNICYAKLFNPAAPVSHRIVVKYDLMEATRIELVDLLDLGKTAVEFALGKKLME